MQMPELKDVFEMATKQAEPDLDSWTEQERRQRRTARNRKVGAFAVAAAIGLAAVALVVATRPGESATIPGGGPAVSPEPMPRPASRPYFLDLRTGEQTPLVENLAGGTDFAASLDGMGLAYVGTGDEGSPQIFIAGIDGTGIRQVTHDPKGAATPAWSPDETSIAYVGYGSGDVQNLFILEIATGETRQITDETRALSGAVSGPSFTPDGSSLVYTDPGSASDTAEMRTVPVAGGQSTILFGGGHGGMGHAGQGSMSPDGSLVTMTGHEINGPGAAVFVSNTDGTQRRAIAGYGTNPAGTWSPDGSRIVCSNWGNGIIVVDIATGDVTRVAQGSEAIWIDRHTLLVGA
jgi:Tol biopolymer transport system component